MMKRYKVGLIFGGRSAEHEISIISAMQVVHFIGTNHDLFPIYITKTGQWLTGSKLLSLDTFKDFDPRDPDFKNVFITPDTKLKIISNPFKKGFLGKAESIELDVIFPVLHGSHGEDGTVQGLLELTNIPYVGSNVFASALAMDKAFTKQMLLAANIPVLEYVSFTRSEWESDQDKLLESVHKKLGFPAIVKPARLGSSIGVAVARDTDELAFNVSVASRMDSKLLVEKFLENITEINCSVLGFDNELTASVCEQPISSGAFLSYDDKYVSGETSQGMAGAKRVVPAPIDSKLTEQIQNKAIETFKSIGCSGVARIDFLVDSLSGRLFVNEINTIPGSLSYYLWEPAGLSASTLMDKLIEIAFKVHKEKNRTTYVTSDKPIISDSLGIKK